MEDNKPSPLINLDKRRADRILLIAILLAIVGVILIVTARLKPAPPPGIEIAKIMIGVFAVTGAFILLIVAMTFWGRRRRAIRDFAGYLKGDFLVHWVYQPEEWEKFVAAEEKRTNKDVRLLAAVFSGIGLVIGVVIALTDRSNSAWTIAGFIWAGMTVLGLATWGIAHLAITARCRRLRAVPGEAYIAVESAYLSGDTLFWGTLMRRLIGATIIDADPAIVEIEVEFSMGKAGTAIAIAAAASGRYAQTRSTMKLRIPIPAGREEIARQVAAMLSAGSR